MIRRPPNRPARPVPPAQDPYGETSRPFHDMAGDGADGGITHHAMTTSWSLGCGLAAWSRPHCCDTPIVLAQRTVLHLRLLETA